MNKGCSCNSSTNVKGIQNMGREIPIACCHTVFTKEQRVEYKSIWRELETRRKGIMELENGYQYQFPGDAETLRLINEWVSMERKCCPFLTFSVISRAGFAATDRRRRS